jgi:hypothetical protein
MTAIPADLGQRILEAARIAAAIHREELVDGSSNAKAGGAGARSPLDERRGNVDLEIVARFRMLGW